MLKNCIAAILIACTCFASHAADFPLNAVPDPLKTWVPWAMDGIENFGCPQQGPDASQKQCVWPGLLDLKVNASGATFSQDLQVHRDTWVYLPGNAQHWPQDVSVDGKPQAVIARDEMPVIKLTRGAHKLTGKFIWTVVPEFLPLPQNTALLKLDLNGKPVSFPVRDESNQLWLQRKADVDSGEQIQLRTFRKVTDGVPITVETYIRLEVSGKGREINLGRTLLPDLIPLELQSTLPAVLKPDGSMTVQVRAGKWEIRLLARQPGPGKTLSLPEGAEEEVWSYEATPLIRTAAIEGPSTVDPQQTTLPPEWRNLPAYLMHAGSTFTFKEIRRGDSDPAPDKLSLRRRLWLSFDGSTLTMSDQIKGDISHSNRLTMGNIAQLGRVSVSGQDQLITRGNDKLAGIEVQRGSIDLGADSVVGNSTRKLSAVTWQKDFDKLGIELILPAGWRLLHAGGADKADGAWLSRWNLLDFFLVLVIALAAGKLWGKQWGVLALFALVLSYQELDAPRYSWIVLFVLIAILRALPASRFQVWIKRLQQVSLLVLILLTLSFATQQVRSALYPVLETDGAADYLYQRSQYDGAPAPAAAPAAMPMEVNAEVQGGSTVAEAPPPPPPRANAPGLIEPRTDRDQMVSKLAKADAMRSYSPAKPKMLSRSQSTNYQALDPDAKVQTGPGLPTWNWRSHRLIFDGPVRQDQQLDLWLLPPWANKLLVVLRLILLGLLLMCVSEFRKGTGSGPTEAGASAASRWSWRGLGKAMSILVMSSLTAWSATYSESAHAQMPDNEKLEELKQKLTRPADCLPDCAEISRMMVQINGSSVRLGLDVDAAIDVALPLPGGIKHWLPAQAQLDGKPAYIRRGDDGTIWLLAPAGRHRVELTGELMQSDTLQLPLPQKPRQVDIHADGWDVAGLSDDSGVADTLQFNRRIKASNKTEASALPSFLRVTRRLILDKEWQVETTVSRLSPMGQPVLAQIPLLPGEAVTTAGLSIKDGKVAVNLGPQSDSIEWRSNLPHTAQLKLSLGQQSNWVETWIIAASGIWHLGTTGLPPLASDASNGENGADLVFRPWPGESLAISIERPQAIPGQTLTIDESRLIVSPGSRATDYQLKLHLRSSRGGDYTLSLPEGAALQLVSINHQVRPLRANGRQLVLPVVPGVQDIEVQWRLDQGVGTSYTTATVNLQQASVNNNLQLKLPRDRWLLLASGPGMGPAILFWGKLIVLLLVAVALGRYAGLPVTTRQWLLLTLGLTQVAWWSAALVVAWFFAFVQREKTADGFTTRWQFNLRQLGLAVLTLVMLCILLDAVQSGLLGQPDMQVVGNGSSANNLVWYLDRAAAELQTAWVLSLPMLVYRGLMLLWALWLAWSLLAWLKWGWGAFASGSLWKQKQRVLEAEIATPEVAVNTELAEGSTTDNQK